MKKKIIIGIIILAIILLIGLGIYFCISQNKINTEVKSNLLEDIVSENNQNGIIIFNVDRQIINDFNYVIYINENANANDSTDNQVLVSIYQIDSNNELKLKKTNKYSTEEWEKLKNSKEYRTANAKYNSSNEDKLNEECFKVRGTLNDYYIYYENIEDILEVFNYKIK